MTGIRLNVTLMFGELDKDTVNLYAVEDAIEELLDGIFQNQDSYKGSEAKVVSMRKYPIE